jgi:hypothetical protein
MLFFQVTNNYLVSRIEAFFTFVANNISGSSSLDPLELSTENMGTHHVTAGKLTDDGVTFTLKAIEIKESKYGEFYVLKGELEDGRAMELAFSSARLYLLLTVNWDALVDRTINISAKGESYDRQYFLRRMG